MDLQFYGANCLSIVYKNTRLVIDDNLSQLGKKPVIKAGDVALFTSIIHESPLAETKITLDCPGEYEVDDISIVGIQARAHMDEADKQTAIMYKISVSDITLLVTGHIYPKLAEIQLEVIGVDDVLVLPVGGNGYTLDGEGALTVIKEIEPKLVIPTHYMDRSLNYPVPQSDLTAALKDMGIEVSLTTPKLKLKSSDLTDVTQLVVLESN